MKNPTWFLVPLGLLIAMGAATFAQRPEIARMPDGKPDLSGTYDAATLTPLERPSELGDRLFLTQEEADELASKEQEFSSQATAPTDPDRQAPPVGGAAGVGFEAIREQGEALGAGNVGGYNWFWVDRGSEAFSIDGKFRTSILTDPPNGRRPPMTPDAMKALMKMVSGFMRNDGTAWWLKEEGPGPYDDIELRPLYERCVLGFSGGPPMLPSLYNNYLRVVQTADHVMIMNEMIHDARVVRLNAEHAPPEMRSWMGDSVGHWDGDTLVIETANFRDQTGLMGASRDLHLVEKLTPLDGASLQYSFTVTDPAVWTGSWTGDYVWPKSDNHIYEYACHEGNYSMRGILKGARLLEADAESSTAGDSND